MNPTNQNEINVLLIIPCYNEETRLDINHFIQFEKNNPHIHFLFVDDGSGDNTSQILRQLSNKMKNASHLILDNNVGKGEAIRNGVLSKKNNLESYDFVGYFDADLSTPLKQINSFLNEIKKNGRINFILGTRVTRLGANVIRKKTRHYLGRVFATVVSVMLNEPIYDSQCGAKLIKSSYVEQLFLEEFDSKWLFDVELIIRWKIQNQNSSEIMFEHPLSEWKDVNGSKLKTKDFLLAPVELFRIWYKYRKFL